MSLPIQVKNLASGQVLNLDLQGADSVESLQAALAASLDVPPDCQKLIFRGKQLQAGKKLSDYNIQPNALLHLVMKLKTSVGVNVRIVTGKVITLDVNPAHKVRDVVAMVQELLAHELTGKPACLNFQGQRLAMDRPVAECRIPDKAVLHLVFVPQFYRSATPYVASDEGDRLRVYGDLGSLYARCGGIFGIATFVDRCMDGWMADAALNANAAVATWHERAQRCGFKFLVTQLMGYLAGGPQCYTGKEMVTAHKHLNISTEQWASFMGVLHKICSDFGLPRDDVDDLTAVISSMMDDCVVAQDETAPPKPPEERIRGGSLYARVGGVYPIALFVDRVIDALLSDSTVKIPFDGQKRNAASLKYLFTELLCHSAGGPEVLTSTRLTETRLLASSKEFFQLMRCAEAASDHIYIGRLRTQLMGCVYDSRDMILDPTRTDTSDPQGLEAKVQKISRETHVPLVYIVGGGAVFLAGRERHFGDANPSQQEQCWRELGKLGFRRQRVLQVKSADEAAAGKSLNDATIQARAAGGGAFVAAQRRVHGDPRTLYGRGGGVFGLAALADRLMDVWMADSELNANAMVARWHNSGQKEGFKFLVTQVMGYLTGGPQRYTGKPMDLAHKHLNISQAQWDKFMADADVVFREFNMEETTQKELRGILESFRTQCVVVPGEKVPEDKGLCRQPPSGSSLYAQAGGVYPLARFVNELIESAFQERLKIFQDNTRTPAGLKYLVTELVCNAAGGPELVTSQGFDDAKLGVLASEWSYFIELAHGAAKLVWGEGSIAACVVQTLEEQRPELCIGIVQDSTATLARQRVRDAGYNMVEVTAAMLQCEGDADKAIELLASGWKPEVQRPNASAARCPFLSGAASSSSASGCPFMAGAAASASAASSSGDRSVVQKSTVMAGRVLGSTWQMRLDDLLLEPAELCCPITLCLFSNPVIASDGCSYERDFIARIAAAGRMSPATHEMLRPEFYSAQSLKDQVETFKSQRAAELLAFARDALDQQADASAVLVGTALDRAKTYISGLPSERQQELAAQYVELCRRVNRPLPSNLLLHVDPAAKIPPAGRAPPGRGPAAMVARSHHLAAAHASARKSASGGSAQVEDEELQQELKRAVEEEQDAEVRRVLQSTVVVDVKDPQKKEVSKENLVTYINQERQRQDDCVQLPCTIAFFVVFVCTVLMHEDLANSAQVERQFKGMITGTTFEGLGPPITAIQTSGHKDMSDIDTVTDIWTYLHDAIVPLFIPADPSSLRRQSDIYRVLRYSHLIGGVQLQQIRRVRRECTAAYPELGPKVPDSDFNPVLADVYCYPWDSYDDTCFGPGMAEEGFCPDSQVLGLATRRLEGEEEQQQQQQQQRQPASGALPRMLMGLSRHASKVEGRSWDAIMGSDGWGGGMYTVLLHPHEGLDRAMQKMQTLKDHTWIDDGTAWFGVKMFLLHPDLSVYLHVVASVWFPPNGELIPGIRLTSFPAEPYQYNSRMALDVVWLILWLYLLVHTFTAFLKAVYKGATGSHFRSFWTWVDIGTVLGGGVMLAGWPVFLTMLDKLKERAVDLSWERPVEESGFQFDNEEHRARYMQRTLLLHTEAAGFSGMVSFYRVFACNYTVLIIVRFFKAFKAQPRLAVVTNTISNSINDIGHFLIVLTLVIISFAAAGMFLFGHRLLEFSEYSFALSSVFLIMMGSFDYGELRDEHPLMAGIWFWSYILFVSLILLNMALAIVMDVYSEVSNVGGADSIWEQATKVITVMWERRDWMGYAKVLTKVQGLNLERLNMELLCQACTDMPPEQAIFLLEGAEGFEHAEAEKGLTMTDAMRMVGQTRDGVEKMASQLDTVIDAIESRRLEHHEEVESGQGVQTTTGRVLLGFDGETRERLSQLEGRFQRLEEISGEAVHHAVAQSRLMRGKLAALEIAICGKNTRHSSPGAPPPEQPGVGSQRTSWRNEMFSS